jgi:hypothetical protein
MYQQQWGIGMVTMRKWEIEFSEGSKNVGECDGALGDKMLLWTGPGGIFLVWIGDTVNFLVLL